MEIWHNPRCSKSRATLTLIEEAGAAVQVRRYLDDPPDVEELRAALARLGLAPWDITRFGEDEARALGLRDWPRDDPERWLEMLATHPRLIERPIVIDGERAVVGRPPENVHDLL